MFGFWSYRRKIMFMTFKIVTSKLLKNERVMILKNKNFRDLSSASCNLRQLLRRLYSHDFLVIDYPSRIS